MLGVSWSSIPSGANSPYQVWALFGVLQNDIYIRVSSASSEYHPPTLELFTLTCEPALVRATGEPERYQSTLYGLPDGIRVYMRHHRSIQATLACIHEIRFS